MKKRIKLIVALSLSLAVFGISFARANDLLAKVEPLNVRQDDNSEIQSKDGSLNDTSPVISDASAGVLPEGHKDVPICIFDCANCPFA